MTAALIRTFEQDPRLSFAAPGTLGVAFEIFQADFGPVSVDQFKRVLDTPFAAVPAFERHQETEFDHVSQRQRVHIRFGFNQLVHDENNTRTFAECEVAGMDEMTGHSRPPKRALNVPVSESGARPAPSSHASLGGTICA